MQLFGNFGLQCETHCELVDGCVLIDDIENRVVISEVGLVIHCPFKCGTGASKH